ncbi:hypothetical protein IEQ34_023966 [Dendrobium chrysotoxum]|uniref:Uncharacterized protein n=1 Tax=Dendrobium chrysotoxum TaxID=161865 RepID=A0AAV7FUU0_DENCH|nr:hypothetical protein IEQ34_024546 [Dendrobium chrysotoxum]KAH0447203.1 hypothetical protein IEQ34_023966 [Dendrobium chrysotoxum]
MDRKKDTGKVRSKVVPSSLVTLAGHIELLPNRICRKRKKRERGRKNNRLTLAHEVAGLAR